LGFDDEGAFQRIAADFGLLFGDEEIEILMREKTRHFQTLVDKGDVLYPDAAPCVERLSPDWPLGIASGALRHEIELMLRGGGLDRAFRFIVAAGETDRTKPAPDPYLRAAELHGVPPTECVAIEDSQWGLQSAREAGMITIGITHTYPRNELNQATLVIDSLDELTSELLRGLG
jgi:beta-phosphoglucomutase